MKIHTYRDLRIWQKGMDFVESIYALTNSFPSSEKFGLTNQIRRSAVSVPSNIAEGHNRRSTKIYLSYLDISIGSLNECMTQIELSIRLGFIDQANGSRVLEQGTILAKQINALKKSLRQKNSIS